MKTRSVLAAIGFSSAIACGSANGADLPSRAVRRSVNDSLRADSIARARQDSINRAQPGYVVDSALAPAEELRRFRAAIGGEIVTSLAGGTTSREQLVRRLVRAVADQDTASMREMLLSPREFADLVYPSSRFARPPYNQPPGLMWSQIVQPSVSGFRRLMRRRGGVAFSYVGHTCDPKPGHEGDNILWTHCVLRLAGPGGAEATERWFGSIIERDGVFKFVSYANQF